MTKIESKVLTGEKYGGCVTASIASRILRTMWRIRLFEEKCAELYALGRLPGFLHSAIGQEAVSAGACAVLRKDDYITSTHRGHGDVIAKGAQLDHMMAELFGKATGYCRGKGGSMHIADFKLGILGANGIVGAGVPIAGGAALSAKIRGTDQVCDGFAWLDPDTVNWNKISPECHPILVGIESLRALKETCDNFCLNTQDLQDIFCNNALRLLDMKDELGTLTQTLYRHAKERIPGGTQLLSKRPEMMAPEQWPAYFREARGCEVWDMDGRHYYDMSTNGIGSCLLGFRDPDVTRAVQRRINLGSMCSLNAPEEVELADLLCEIHPWSKQVRFTRSGGEAAAVAVRIARATTDRSLVAVCGYHGWHDWYLAANLGESDALRGHLLPGLDPLGVPKELRGTAVTFKYNSREEFQNILDKYGDNLAAVIMEPCRNKSPEPGFLEFVRNGAHRCGALVIFDEITIGWRLHFGGAHLKFGVNPDIAIFAKAIGNGHPIGAVIGTEDAMAGAQSSFISSTYWTESVGPTAVLATIHKMQRLNIPSHVAHIGTLVRNLWKHHGVKHGLPTVVEEGYPCLAKFSFEHELADELRTLYTQFMLERGFLAGCSVYATLAHTEEIVSLYGEAIDDVFGEISNILQSGRVKKSLKGPVAHTGFRRLI